MYGGMQELGFYYLCYAVTGFWMLARVWRSSPGLALAMIVFPPAILLALVKYWGDGYSDIRVPAAVALVLGVLVFRSAERVEREMGPLMAELSVDDLLIDDGVLLIPQADIDLLRTQNPLWADQIESRQTRALEQLGLSRSDFSASMPRVVTFSDRGSSPAPVVEAPRPAPLPTAASIRPLAPELDRQRQFQQSARVGHVFGTPRFEAARSALALPSGYSFVDRSQLGWQMRLRELDPGPALLGWIVHRDVQLAAEDALFVIVEFHEIGRLPSEGVVTQPEVLADDSQEDAPSLADRLAGHLRSERALSLASGLLAPTWLEQHGIATWALLRDRSTGPAQGEAFALRPLRHGVLLFRVQGISEAQLELGVRAALLMASRVQTDAGWSHSDFARSRDRIAEVDLSGFMAAVSAGGRSGGTLAASAASVLAPAQ